MGDRVMIYAPHCPQWIVAWLASQKLGAVGPLFAKIDDATVAAEVWMRPAASVSGTR